MDLAHAPTRDTNIEHEVIALCLLEGRAPPAGIDDLFADDAAKVACEAMRLCEKRGQPIDSVSVTAALKDLRATHRQLMTFVEIGSLVPAHPDSVIDRLGELAARRRRAAHIHRAQVALGRGAVDEARAALDAAEAQSVARRAALPKLAEVAKRLPGSYKRLPTSVPKLDEITRGGLQTKRLVILAGRPGGYKTTLALHIGMSMARGGVDTPNGHVPIFVAVRADDEARIGLMSRAGQSFGLTRDELESEDLAVSGPAWERVAEEFARLPDFTIVGAGEAGEPETFEAMAELALAEAKARGARLVLVLDSLHKGRFACDAASHEQTTREKINARLEVMLRFVLAHDACIIATAELNRGGYSENVAPQLSHLKESGDIEYKADLVLGMHRPDPDDGYVVEVGALKNRISSEHDGVRFRLRRTTRCTFEDVAMPDEAALASAAVAQREAVDEAAVAELADRIEMKLVSASRRISSREDLNRLVPAARARQAKAVSLLITSGRVEKVKGFYERVGR